MTLKGDTSLGSFLGLLNLCVWGSWSYLRKYSNCSNVVFCHLYIVGHFVSAILLVCTVEYPTNFFYMLNEKVYVYKVLLIILAGWVAAQADFVCINSWSYVPVYISFPVYTGTAMIFGMVLTYIIQQSSSTTALSASNSAYLFIGVVFGFIAVISLGLAESQVSSNCDNDEVSKAAATDNVTNASASAKAASKRWIYIIFTAGLCLGLWGFLTAVGTSGSFAVDPYICLVFFVTGELTACLTLFTTYGKLIYNDNSNYYQEFMMLTMKDVFFGILGGMFVGVGYYLYYKASTMIPKTTALGLGTCEPLFNMIIGILFHRSLHNSTNMKKLYMITSVISFIIAILFMIKSSG